jgi:hypothetical protein
MHVIRTLFGLRTIYSKQTWQQILYVYVLLAGFAWFGLAAMTSSKYAEVLPYLTVLLAVIVGVAALRTTIRTLLVNQYVGQNKNSVLVIPPAEVGAASINLELDRIDKLEPVAIYKNARLFLATFNFYTHTKYGDFLAKQVYYNVLEVQLARQLPHIIFDSKVARKRQFKSLYLSAQRISVQGPFDQIFDTYVPETYDIDSLSFVTPEVMELMVQARKYDIEIINDKLLLYAPLLSKQDLDAFADQGRAIAAELNDNINTYRDDRLTGDARKTNVTLFARSLLRSPFKHLVTTSFFGVITVGIIIASFFVSPEHRFDVLINGPAAIVYASFVSSGWQAGKIIRDNRKALEGYRVLYQTNRGKPIRSTIV